MTSKWIVPCLLAGLASCSRDQRQDPGVRPDLRLITLDPGHFHAALIQKERLPGFSDLVRVYAPLGPDLMAHVERIRRFNGRGEGPTDWRLDIHAGPDFLERMTAEGAGDVVILSGRNRRKLEYIAHCVSAGLHTLADKPWIIEAADLPGLEAVLQDAERKNVVAYDAMTQRFQIAYILQRELVGDPQIFGTPIEGSESEPAVRFESVHHLLKIVAGAPNLRPAWFFDIAEQGEALTDVGTHLVDLVQWILFPETAIHLRKDIQMLSGSRWPTPLSLEEFGRVTGEREFPLSLAASVRDGRLIYQCNNAVSYRLRGLHVRVETRWDFEAPAEKNRGGGAATGAPSGDTELAIFRGSRSRVEVRQSGEENFRPEVYIVAGPLESEAVRQAVERRLGALATSYPGLSIEDQGPRLRVVIPDKYRLGHEAHFAVLVERFLGYVRDPASLPSWETPNMLAKYYVTTKGVELARAGGTQR